MQQRITKKYFLNKKFDFSFGVLKEKSYICIVTKTKKDKIEIMNTNKNTYWWWRYSELKKS